MWYAESPRISLPTCSKDTPHSPTVAPPRCHSVQTPGDNLGDNINESELCKMMSCQQGYRHLQVVKRPGSTTGEQAGASKWEIAGFGTGMGV